MSCLFYQGALERALSDVKPVKIKLDGSVPVSAENFERFMAVVNSRDMSALSSMAIPCAVENSGAVSEENIRVIRPLAVGFGIRELVQSINQFLLRAEDISLFEKFKLADQWQDRELSVSHILCRREWRGVIVGWPHCSHYEHEGRRCAPG